MTRPLASLERIASGVVPFALGLSPTEYEIILASCRHLLTRLGSLGRLIAVENTE